MKALLAAYARERPNTFEYKFGTNELKLALETATPAG
jgi:hypothetical protein